MREQTTPENLAEYRTAKYILPLDVHQGAQLPDAIAAVAVRYKCEHPPIVLLNPRMRPSQEGRACVLLVQGLEAARALVIVLFSELREH